MRTHLGCTGRIELGSISQETQRRLERVEAIWLEFSPDPSRLVIRHVQPDDTPALREIAGELLEFLIDIPEAERRNVRGGALYYLDEQSGQFVRIKVWEGAFVTVAWAQPSYAHAPWLPYRGEAVPLVFEAYQRLNGVFRLQATHAAADEIRHTIERNGGLYPQGDFEILLTDKRIEVKLLDVNASVLPLLKVLRQKAEPASSLEGEIDVSSFRSGDVEEYCRFILRAGEIWIARPELWADRAEAAAEPIAPAA
ncbi:MAG: hypothetical protein ACE145_06505 [Terriglobia bacterium]